MLGILGICLCLFFRDASILNKIAILGQSPWLMAPDGMKFIQYASVFHGHVGIVD